MDGRPDRPDRENSWPPGNTKGLNLQQPQKVPVCIGGPNIAEKWLMEMSLSPSTWVLIPPSFKNGAGSQRGQSLEGAFAANLGLTALNRIKHL